MTFESFEHFALGDSVGQSSDSVHHHLVGHLLRCLMATSLEERNECIRPVLGGCWYRWYVYDRFFKKFLEVPPANQIKCLFGRRNF